jgi:general secretion pathway protein K
MKRHRQRGAALITAVLIVALAATTAGVMLQRQSATLNQAALVMTRAQADLYSRAGIDWARAVVALDQKSAGTVDHLGEPWASPMLGLPVEGAVIGGSLADAQARFNLNNLVNGNARNEAEVEAFKRLLTGLQLAPDLAEAVVDWIDADDALTGSGGAEDAYYLSLPQPYRTANQPLVQVEELLRVKGFDAKTFARLKPYVTALPGRTLVNANTAAPQVLAAYLAESPDDEVRKLVAARAVKPFASIEDLKSRAKGANGEAIQRAFDVKTAFFLAEVSVSAEGVETLTEALLRRGENQAPAIIWQKSVF